LGAARRLAAAALALWPPRASGKKRQAGQEARRAPCPVRRLSKNNHQPHHQLLPPRVVCPGRNPHKIRSRSASRRASLAV